MHFVPGAGNDLLADRLIDRGQTVSGGFWGEGSLIEVMLLRANFAQAAACSSPEKSLVTAATFSAL